MKIKQVNNGKGNSRYYKFEENVRKWIRIGFIEFTKYWVENDYDFN